MADTQLNRVSSSQDKGARRVAFTETLPKHRAASSDGDGDSDHDAKCRCFACCAWTCLGLSGIFLALLILGVIFVSFIQSDLPEMRVQRLLFPKFQIVNSTNQKSVLDSKIELTIEMRNNNDIVDLHYSDIEVDVATDDVKLGSSAIPAFSHRPGNLTILNITTTVVKGDIDTDDASLVEDDLKKVKMEVQVTIKAHVSFHFAFLRLNKLPIMADCVARQVDLVQLVKEPLCNIRMFPTR